MYEVYALGMRALLTGRRESLFANNPGKRHET
jgi:hypothetical protein